MKMERERETPLQQLGGVVVAAASGREKERERLLDLLRWRRELELLTATERDRYGFVFPVFMHAPTVYFYVSCFLFFSGFSLLSACVFFRVFLPRLLPKFSR